MKELLLINIQDSNVIVSFFDNFKGGFVKDENLSKKGLDEDEKVVFLNNLSSDYDLAIEHS